MNLKTIRMRLKPEEATLIEHYREGVGTQSDALLKQRVLELTAQVKNLTSNSTNFEELKALFELTIGATDKAVKDTAWMHTKPIDDSGWGSGIPTLMLSDLHFGEVVRKEEVNAVNEYNTAIAVKRLENVITGCITHTRQYKNAVYGGIVVNLMGDMISGELHDLAEFNDANSLQSTITVVDCLITAIERLKREFKRVHVNGVVGNHDRMTYRRTKTKGSVYDSHAWMIYKLIERHFNEDKDISFNIADGHCLLYKVNGRTFLASHGDEIKGGNSAISGVLTAFTLACMRKVKQWAGRGIDVQTCLFGHFHTFSLGHRYSYIANGSLVGVGEYSLKYNFGYEPPQQVLFVTMQNGDIAWCNPVLADQATNMKAAPKWVTVHKGFAD